MQEYSFYSILLLILFLLFVKFQSKNVIKEDYIIISATYFNQSKLYPDNSIIVLFNAQKSISQIKDLICVTENDSYRNLSPTNPKFAYNPTRECKFGTFIAVCNSVANPTTLGLTKNNGEIAQIPIRESYNKKVPVVVCFSPLFYFEKWELLITSLEIYKYYGAHLQVLYVQSMIKEIYSLLKLYDESFVTVEPWSIHDLDEKLKDRITYDPNLELDWRNQAAAHTDCTIKYRESSDFIIIGDLDDVLVPLLEKNYLSEFNKLSSSFKNSLGFAYYRYNLVMDSARKPNDYSISDVIESMKVSKEKENYKYVLDTRRVETSWIHWPGIVKNGYELIIIPDSYFMLHLRNWTNTVQNTTTFIPHLRQIDTFISQKDELLLQINYVKRLKDKKEFNNLPTKQVYSDLMNDCYEKMFYSKKRQPNICPGPARCVFDPQPGIHCMVAKKYLTTTTVDTHLTITTPSSRSFFTMYKSGCFMR